GSETRFVPGPGVPLRSRDALSPVPHRAFAREAAGWSARRQRRAGTRDPGLAPSAPSPKTQVGPPQAHAIGSGAPGFGQPAPSSGPVGLVHRDPSDARSLAPGAGP